NPSHSSMLKRFPRSDKGSVCNGTKIFAKGLVAVVLRLEGPGAFQPEVFRLFFRKRRELDAELAEVQAGYLLVEVLGQDVDLVLVFVVIVPKLDPRQHLVGEGGGLDEAR